MIASPYELAEIEKFFAGRELPKVLKLYGAITFNDLPTYVRKAMDNLKTGEMSDAVARPRWMIFAK